MIKKFIDEYDKLVAVTNDMISYNYQMGIVPISKVGIWIKDHVDSPLEEFNLFLLSNGYKHHLADIRTRELRRGESTVYATTLLDRTRGSERPLDKFRNAVLGGLKIGYTVKYIHYSPNGKKIQENYITDLFMEDSVGSPLCCSDNPLMMSSTALCPRIEAAYIVETLEEAEGIIRDLEDVDPLLRSKFVRPVIVELHEQPFKNREIRMSAFTYTK